MVLLLVSFFCSFLHVHKTALQNMSSSDLKITLHPLYSATQSENSHEKNTSSDAEFWGIYTMG